MKTKKIKISIDFNVDVIQQDIMVGVSGLISKYRLYIQTSCNDFDSCDLFTKKISLTCEFRSVEEMFDFNKELQEILL